MLSIYKKELKNFFSSLIGYVVIGVFLIILGLILWVFPDTSILSNPYANLNTLFEMAPFVFIFLISAVTMRTFAEEQQEGTLEMLLTKPLSEIQIILGKFFAALTLVVITLLPVFLYYYSVYDLGSPKGNIDRGGFLGSYIGLIFLAGILTSIGLFCSALVRNQIVSFLLSLFVGFFMFYFFEFVSNIPSFVGKIDDLIQQIGIADHYDAVSVGVLDTRDLVYFLVVTLFFLNATLFVLEKRKW